MAIKVIAGLGNPGKDYTNTRHNIGFETVDLIADELGLSWKKWSKGIALVSNKHPEYSIFFIKPLKYMNNSGLVLREFLSYNNLLPDEMLVVTDDFNISLGELRLRKSGSSGGHNGLASIIDNIGSSSFPRLRLGIGNIPQNTDSASFVLSKFLKKEKDVVENMKKQAVDSMKMILNEGLDKALSKMPAKNINDNN